MVIIKGGLNSNIIFISLPTLQKRKKGTGKKVFDFVKIGVSWFQNLMFLPIRSNDFSAKICFEKQDALSNFI